MRLVPTPADYPNCRKLESVEVREVHHPLIWLQPDDRRDVVRLDGACNRIRPVAVTSPDLNASDDPLINQVAVVTWNTYLGRGKLDELVTRLERGEFTAGTAPQAFILLLQEVYRSPILDFARRRKLHAVYAPTRRRDGELEDRGSAIISTLRLDDVLVAELPFEKYRRIALGASFQGRRQGGVEWQLRLVNVHFDTAVALARGGPSASRRRQGRALIEVLNAWPAPLIVAGDFNVWWGDDEPTVKEMRRNFPDAQPIRARETWRGPLGVGNKLDYVFAKGWETPLTVRRLESRFGSDHWPLITVVPTQ
jgi:endonuclease/exonuclease/phosphatase family metal-dependent hydrolase